MSKFLKFISISKDKDNKSKKGEHSTKEEVPPAAVTVPDVSGPPEPNDVIDEFDFFSDATGMTENDFKALFDDSKKDKINEIIVVKESSDLKGLTNPKKRASDESSIQYKCGGKRIMINNKDAGVFLFPTVEELAKYTKKVKKEPIESCKMYIDVPVGKDFSKVDITQVQTDRANEHATFQVASNLNTMEPPNEDITPEDGNFVTLYLDDKTQGPMASISAAPAAIARVYCMFHSEKDDPSMWYQTGEEQISMLSKLNTYYTTSNGYVVNYGGEKSFEKKDIDKLCQKVHIGIQYDLDAMYGKRADGKMDKLKRPVKINQVFCAGMNKGQGENGATNKELDADDTKSTLLLRACYQGTYYGAICMGSEKLFLTLVGGGVFGNSFDSIVDEIVKAHKEIANNKKVNGVLKEVHLLLFSPTSKMIDDLIRKFKEENIEMDSNDEALREKMK